MKDLMTIYGPGIPEPIAVRRSDWNASPYTGGSYSNPAVDSTPLDHDAFLEPVGERLYFAGEHTSSAYPSTVHGAYLSGLDAAARCEGQVATATQASRQQSRQRRTAGSGR